MKSSLSKRASFGWMLLLAIGLFITFFWLVTTVFFFHWFYFSLFALGIIMCVLVIKHIFVIKEERL